MDSLSNARDLILNAIANSKNIVIITHARPDGDCLGAAFAVREYCKSVGISVDLLNDSPMPDSYAFLDCDKIYNKVTSDKYDTAIVLDCANKERFQYFDKQLNNAKNVIWIDHHLGDYGYGNINWVVPEASSTCELVYDIFSSVYMTQKFATYLLVGLSTDTGHFMHQNTNEKVLNIASKLVSVGAKISEITNKLYKSRSKRKTKLIARAINEMRFYHNDDIALIPLTRSIFDEYDSSANETEGLIDYAMAIGNTKIAICMSENNENQYKVSFRSRTIDVAEIASHFGGGGHKFAAGCQIFGYLEDVVDKVIREVKNTVWAE